MEDKSQSQFAYQMRSEREREAASGKSERDREEGEESSGHSTILLSASGSCAEERLEWVCLMSVTL